MSADVVVEREALVRMLAAWCTAIARVEAHAAAALAALDARASADEVSVGQALLDHAHRAELLGELAQVRQEREDLGSLVSPWTARPWRAPSRSEAPTPTERPSR